MLCEKRGSNVINKSTSNSQIGLLVLLSGTVAFFGYCYHYGSDAMFHESAYWLKTEAKVFVD